MSKEEKRYTIDRLLEYGFPDFIAAELIAKKKVDCINGIYTIKKGFLYLNGIKKIKL